MVIVRNLCISPHSFLNVNGQNAPRGYGPRSFESGRPLPRLANFQYSRPLLNGALLAVPYSMGTLCVPYSVGTVCVCVCGSAEKTGTMVFPFKGKIALKIIS